MQRMLMGGITEPGGTSAAMAGYVGMVRDTDFGGKTGTSNNHSDAWYMCISPKLVCGAWVGGEYRSIHFRTGALGQGSRTALPICGKFMMAVMSDNRMREYHGRFTKPSEKEVMTSLYDCAGYVPEIRDTIMSDSTDISSEGLYDEDGNPINVQGELLDPLEEGEANEEEGKPVTFEDL